MKLIRWRFKLPILQSLALLVNMCAVITMASANKPEQGLEKRIHLSFNKVNAYTLLKEIERKASVDFAFTEDVQLEKLVFSHIHYQNSKLSEILSDLFKAEKIVFEEQAGTISLRRVQQGLAVNGQVRDATSGSPVIGANIQVKGTSQRATTDHNGHYQLQVPTSQSVLVFSYIGYRSHEVTVNGQARIDVTLQEDNNPLNEVVVTALGISREAKSIGFSQQKVEGQTIQESHETNLLNTLNGRVAGVRITNSSGGIGSSANIQIRGQNFVSGYNYNNSPLFVVDGVPISNNNEQSTRAYTGRQDFNNPNFTAGEGEVDYGNAAGELDPNDIESITVLKGPNAAALYGSRAANGVVLITTKSGKGTKGVGVSFNSQASAEAPLKLPDYQYEYGQGRDGEYSYVDGMGGGLNDNVMENWGPRLNGQLIPQFDSPIDPATGQRIPTPFIAYPNQLKDFFQTGQTFTNNLAIAGSNEKLNFRFSYTNTSQRGIVPNTDLSRNAVGLNAGYAITPKLKIDVNMNYVNSGSDNRASYGAKNEDAIMKIFLYMPRNVNINSLRNYWADGSLRTRQLSPIWGLNSSRLNNPYFVAYENLNGNNRDRVYGNVKFTYNFLPNLSLMLRTGRDFYNDKRTMRHAVSSAQYVNGYYQEDDVYFLETNHDALLSYHTKINDDFSVNASLGGNLMNQESKRLGAIVDRLSIPNVYNLTNNASPIVAGNIRQQKKINSVYGTAQVGYKDALFLDLTGRNDWSSALPKQNRSYFYPSASLSLVATELFGWRSDALSYLKLRSSLSSVRRDLEPYQTMPNFQVTQGWNGETVAVHNNNYPNPDIRPEKVSSYEFGFDSRFFNNRLGIDFTYYRSTTTDLIIPVTLNPSAGYDTKLMNVGKMKNNGVELMIDVTPIRTNQFSWNVNVNFGLNRNRVLYLAEDLGISRIRQLERWASLEMRTENTKGDGSFGSLYGDYLIYQNGTLTHRNGLPQEENGDWGYLGNVNPDYTGGITNQFSYRNFDLSFLFGFQKGGVVHSRTYIEGINSGSLKESLVNRDANGGGTMIGEGVDIDTGEPNDTEVTVRNYWRAYYNNDRIATFDASYIKLREVKITYRLPEKLLKRTPIRQASFSLVGRNLVLWSDVPNIDPEVSGYDGQFQGLEAFSLPSLRSFGAALNINF
ncbi:MULTISPECIES: SusC/RagA family TonB-linked outer membrane protein [Olivibacter]|uniref:SusC/RagA family TonB-linked outer membrane protein n=1 Tax=Olivibacter oleidegradans TaxID=760123 RepID=A0ABV6HEE7_9SPHI|nr:SusC/RagA family TonB-linked outer membrane protein [Olivibacter jilunii]MCL4641045.1 SusC/RagA family TonB-linked outer membrane protein [Olivibacter sp. UJ_SKK_5.1]